MARSSPPPARTKPCGSGTRAPARHSMCSMQKVGRCVWPSAPSAPLWKASRGDLLLELRGHTEAVLNAAFSRDGTRLATASMDRTARLWEAQTGNFLRALPHQHEVTCVAFSPDSTRLATGASDG